MVDELPVQFQKRDFELKTGLHASESKPLTYELRPLTRGEYSFGVANIFAETGIGLVQRRFQAAAPMGGARLPFGHPDEALRTTGLQPGHDAGRAAQNQAHRA